MAEDSFEGEAGATSVVPVTGTPVESSYALVEIFGHRTHWGDVREIEAFGAKLLEVTDADTGKVHSYGGAAIFSMTKLSAEEMQQHLEEVRRRKERDAQWRAEYGQRRAEREACVEEFEDADPATPF